MRAIYGQVKLADPKGALLPQLVLLHQDFPLNILPNKLKRR